MTQALKAALFYLLLAFLVIGAPSFIIWTGPYFSTIFIYFVIILVSLAAIWLSKIRLNVGSLALGFLLSCAAMGSFLVVSFAAGLATPGDVSPLLLQALLGGVLMQAFVASAEELSFRGYLLNALDGLGFVPAAVISSIGFTLLHLPSIVIIGTPAIPALVAVCTITAGGLLFALLYRHSGINAAIGFHFGWNFIQYHLFGFGGVEVEPVFDVTLSGPELLTGGQFGPEASVLGMAAMVATLIAVWYYYRKKGEKKISEIPTH